jgi:NTE family protein
VRAVIIFLLSVLLCAPVWAQTAARPRIGLVLGGGGAKGFAHIGVLEELERRRIPVDAIAGTSMGAVVGSIYATGRTAADTREVARTIDWVTLFDDSRPRSDLSFRRKREVRAELLDSRLGLENGKPVLPRGVLGGQKLFATLQELLAPWRATEDFDALATPFRAVATNIVTGQAVVMGSGNLSTAVLASMSVPGGFPPVTREGLLLVDGSISDNLPVDVARAMGVDVVIVVDVGEQPKSSADKINSAVDVLTQMQSLLGWDAIRRQRQSVQGRDVLIDPDISGLSVTSFDKSVEIMQRGQAAAQAQAAKLDALSVSEAEYAAWANARKQRAQVEPIRIAKVEVNNQSRQPTTEIAKLITTRPGDTLDAARMKRDVAAIYELDGFDRVDYQINRTANGNTLQLNATGAKGRDRYLMGGLLLSSDFGRSALFDLALGYTDLDFLNTGAQWRGYARVGNDVQLDVSLFKQFGRFFVEPTANYQRNSALVLNQTGIVQNGNFSAARASAGVDGGLLFGNRAELRVGVRLGGVNPQGNAQAFGLDQGWTTDNSWRVGVTIDTLDNVTFPQRGVFAQAQLVNHVRALGGKFSRDNINLQYSQALPLAANTTLVATGRLGLTANRANDLLGDYLLGGFLNLSGLQRNSLLGQQLLFLRGVVYHRISQKAPILDLPIYVGASLEAGNVWRDPGDMSLGSMRTGFSAFVAADTLIGPVWLAYGNSEGSSTVYLVLGRTF